MKYLRIFVINLVANYAAGRPKILFWSQIFLLVSTIMHSLSFAAAELVAVDIIEAVMAAVQLNVIRPEEWSCPDAGAIDMTACWTNTACTEGLILRRMMHGCLAIDLASQQEIGAGHIDAVAGEIIRFYLAGPLTRIRVQAMSLASSATTGLPIR